MRQLASESYESSVALVRISITLATSIDEGLSARFLERYQRALAAFRNELNTKDDQLNPGTVLAGIELCTVEVCSLEMVQRLTIRSESLTLRTRSCKVGYGLQILTASLDWWHLIPRDF